MHRAPEASVLGELLAFVIHQDPADAMKAMVAIPGLMSMAPGRGGI
jgi:hypothetical protein